MEDELDYWLFVLKNMSKLNKIPVFLKKPIFEKLFDIAEYSKLKKEERAMYDASLKRKWDAYTIKESIRVEKEKAREKAREEGREEANRDVVKSLLASGTFNDEQIAELVKMPLDFIREVKKGTISK